ncbi:MAG TPA: hypothetical protein VM284_06015 [Candidatus Limnocylindria bacterium]|nr:hypothetical protein [Candidatus Limnocylindria bacterium]
MRKRFSSLLLPAALLFLMLMPGQAVAAPSFTTTVERDTCVAGAGKYGFGQGVLRIRIIEYGRSGANRFTFTAQVWHLPIHGSTWSMEHQWALGEYTFPDNNQSYFNSRQYAWAPNHNAYHKIVIRVRALHDNTVLYSKLFQGKTC